MISPSGGSTQLFKMIPKNNKTPFGVRLLSFEPQQLKRLRVLFVSKHRAHLLTQLGGVLMSVILYSMHDRR